MNLVRWQYCQGFAPIFPGGMIFPTKGELLSFWNLLNRCSTPAEPLAATDAAVEPALLSPAERADLEAAWDELNQALGESNVTSLRACSRNGHHWSDNPESVRAIAATIRDVTKESTGGLPG